MRSTANELRFHFQKLFSQAVLAARMNVIHAVYLLCRDCGYRLWLLRERPFLQLGQGGPTQGDPP